MGNQSYIGTGKPKVKGGRIHRTVLGAALCSLCCDTNHRKEEGQNNGTNMEGTADHWGIYDTVAGGAGAKRFYKKKTGGKDNAKKAIREGIAEADYAAYALRYFGIVPSVFLQMNWGERLFLESVIELEVENHEGI